MQFYSSLEYVIITGQSSQDWCTFFVTKVHIYIRVLETLMIVMFHNLLTTANYITIRQMLRHLYKQQRIFILLFTILIDRYDQILNFLDFSGYEVFQRCWWRSGSFWMIPCPVINRYRRFGVAIISGFKLCQNYNGMYFFFPETFVIILPKGVAKEHSDRGTRILRNANRQSASQYRSFTVADHSAFQIECVL